MLFQNERLYIKVLVQDVTKPSRVALSPALLRKYNLQTPNQQWFQRVKLDRFHCNS